MSKKHFIELANTVRKLRPIKTQAGSQYGDGFHDGEMLHYECTVKALADFCQSQNSQFKRDRWLDYIAGECGPNGGKVGK